MSYDTLRNATRRLLQAIEETQGYRGRIVIDEHPWGAEDIFTVSGIRDGLVVCALILRVDLGFHVIRLDKVDMSTLARHTVVSFSTNEGRINTPEALSQRILMFLRGYLGASGSEIAQEREAVDLRARTKATRPGVVSQVSPAKSGGFDLMLHGLTANDVLRAIEAIPEVTSPVAPRTAYDHLLADEI